MEQRYAFVLRIWITESIGPGGQPIDLLHGTLQAIDSPSPQHFASLHRLNELIYRAVHPPEPPGASLPGAE